VKRSLLRINRVARLAAALAFALLALVDATRAAPAPQIFLPLVAKGGTPDTRPTPDGPTSEELIAAALKAGAIDQQTALRYQLLAAFGDPRLPQPLSRPTRCAGPTNGR
jgi:hypothetical protein